ncbi:hypothetical protein BGZ95_007915, partial [Linnemannia exigua]
MSKRPLDDDVTKRSQAVRPLYNQSNSNGNGSGSPTITTSIASRSESDIVHIDIHLDANGKEIVLWEDILVAFKGAVNVRHNIRVLPFLKDKNFDTLKPLRIAAVSNATLDVYIEGNVFQNERDTARMRSAASHIQPPPPRKRGPQDDTDLAFCRLMEFERINFDDSVNIDSNDDSSPTTDNDADTILTPYDAIMTLSKKAREGDMSAQVELGKAYFLGRDDVLPQDSEMALDWFLQAANRGNAEAQAYAGMFYYDGRGG